MTTKFTLFLEVRKVKVGPSTNIKVTRIDSELKMDSDNFYDEYVELGIPFFALPLITKETLFSTSIWIHHVVSFFR